ncbi:MAG: phosphoribosyltransferase [Terriglobales bacterium]
MLFQDRREAGRYLAAVLHKYAGRPDVLVLALPRGGVPVAYEIARVLNAPLDIFVVRKLGAPGQEELAMGAIASGGVRVLNHDVVRALGITGADIERITVRENEELKRREKQYRGDRPPVDASGKVVILVDDGLATGSTMRAAAAALRRMGPLQIVVAVPVAAAQSCDDLRAEVDELVCGATPAHFFAVGQWYRDFEQTTDEEVRSLLQAVNENSTLHS